LNAVSGADAFTVTLCVTVLELVPAELLTVSVTVYVPAVRYVSTGFSIALVVPSPKLHDHTFGLPDEVSVNVATCPFVTTVNDAVIPELPAAVTVMLWLLDFDPAALLAVSVIVNVPALAKMWLGFCDVLVDPSPKFQDQPVGLPVEVSVNVTDCAVVGEAGENVNDAVGALAAALTVTLWLAEFDPPALLAVSVTVNVPALANVWLGLCDELVDASPKFQDHPVGLPVEVSVRVTACAVVGEAGENVNPAEGAKGVEGDVNWREPPPQPESTKQASRTNRSGRILIGIPLFRQDCNQCVYLNPSCREPQIAKQLRRITAPPSCFIQQPTTG
jgi:hypothetical protein